MLDFSQLPDVSKLHPELKGPGEREFAAHMKAREDALRHIFGAPYPNGNILVASDTKLMLNWPGGGVYQYPANLNRHGWHYVTSGLAQPVPDNNTATAQDIPFSGLGIELVISTPERAAWPLDVLINLVRYLLFQKTARVVLPGDRVPCNGPLVRDTDTKLNHLLARFSSEYENEIGLPAGRCCLVHLVGVTEAEIANALTLGKGTAGSIVLSRVMDEMGVGCVSDPRRECLTTRDGFSVIWNRAKSECEAIWQFKAAKRRATGNGDNKIGA
jgi:hypothetical protein